MKKTIFLLTLSLMVLLSACEQKPVSSFEFDIPTGEAPADIAFKNTSKDTDSYFGILEMVILRLKKIRYINITFQERIM
jgi:hypothetical protein